MIERARIWSFRRGATLAFAAVAVVAIPGYLLAARDQWFFQDEWAFLAHRDGGDLHDLFRPHNEHWSTAPIIAYRMLWRVVGLQSYVAYQVPVVVAHVLVGALVFLVARRSGVHPWIAAAAGSAFVLLGSGYQNIVWGFSISFVGALLLGLTHVVLADHDGPIARRDVAGIGAGVLALTFAGVAVTTAFVVGLATLLRRGWRVALVHTVPPAAVYLAWWGAVGRASYRDRGAAPLDVAAFTVRGLRSTFERLGQIPVVSVALVGVLVVGIVVLVRSEPGSWRTRSAVPIAMAVGAVVFFAISGVGRVPTHGIEFAERNRYSHVASALLLPAIALAADTLTRGRRWLVPGAVLLLLLGVPGNLAALETRWYPNTDPGLVLAVAYSDALADAPSELRPFEPEDRMIDERGFFGGIRHVTVGWLREGLATGRVPRPAWTPPEVDAKATLLLALHLDEIELPRSWCEPLTAPERTTLGAGDGVGFGGSVLVRVRGPQGGWSESYPVRHDLPTRIIARHGPVEVEIGPHHDGGLTCG